MTIVISDGQETHKTESVIVDIFCKIKTKPLSGQCMNSKNISSTIID